MGKNLKNWLPCLPYIKCACNHAKHSPIKQSSFKVVYGFNPLAPLDLSPLLQAIYSSVEGETKAKFVKKLHQLVRGNLEKKTDKYKKQADKGRKEINFEPGD